MENKSPTLFISYSHDGKEHKDWVYKLAHDLTTYANIDVLLDEFVRTGENLELFMKRDLSNSKNVVCICSSEYNKKSKKPNSGVYKEIKTLKEMTKNADLDNIIPVIKDNPNKTRPDFLSELKYLNADEEKYYNIYGGIRELLWGEDKKKKPYYDDKNPYTDSQSDELDCKINDYKVMFHNTNFEDTVRFDYKKSNKEYTIGSGKYTFTTRWSERSKHGVYAYNYPNNISAIAYNPDITEMPDSINQILNIYETADFYPDSFEIDKGDLVIWKNKNNKYAVTKIEDINNDNHKIHELEFSYKIIEEP